MKILTEEDYKEIDLSSTHNLIEINPFKIEIVQSDTGMMAKLQKKTSKAIWRPAPGRKLAFLVLHDNILIGLIFLAISNNGWYIFGSCFAPIPGSLS